MDFTILMMTKRKNTKRKISGRADQILFAVYLVFVCCVTFELSLPIPPESDIIDL